VKHFKTYPPEARRAPAKAEGGVREASASLALRASLTFSRERNGKKGSVTLVNRLYIALQERKESRMPCKSLLIKLEIPHVHLMQ
jgi:hypothetical protein